jgi:hypothetical protein
MTFHERAEEVANLGAASSMDALRYVIKDGYNFKNTQCLSSVLGLRFDEVFAL